jgi:hypothetical protein
MLLLALPALAVAAEVNFTFNGTINGPDTPFTFGFTVDTATAGNTLVDTFENGTLSSIAVNLVASDFTATFNGVPLPLRDPATMTFSGHDTAGNGGFWGSSLGITGGPLNFIDVPQFGLGTASQAAIQGSSDPLALLLSGSWYGTDDPALLFVNAAGPLEVTFVGTAVDPPAANVPTPKGFFLMLLGLLAVLSPLAFTERDWRLQ